MTLPHNCQSELGRSNSRLNPGIQAPLPLMGHSSLHLRGHQPSLNPKATGPTLSFIPHPLFAASLAHGMPQLVQGTLRLFLSWYEGRLHRRCCLTMQHPGTWASYQAQAPALEELDG